MIEDLLVVATKIDNQVTGHEREIRRSDDPHSMVEKKVALFEVNVVFLIGNFLIYNSSTLVIKVLCLLF